MDGGRGKVHCVGGSNAYNLYAPANIGVDSKFPWSAQDSGEETEIAVVVPEEAVLISRADGVLQVGDLTEEERAQIAAILKPDTNTTQNHD